MILEKLILTPNVSEYNLLTQFDAFALDEPVIEALSKSVYKIHGKHGADYVVRLPSHRGSTVREEFAVAFLSSVPNLETPGVKLLNSTESHAIFDRVKKAYPVEVKKLMDGWQFETERTLNEKNIRATVSIFYPLENASIKLSELGVTDPLREKIAQLADSFVSSRGRLKEMISTQVRSLIKEASIEKKQMLESDLHRVLPAARPFDYETKEDFLMRICTTLDRSKTRELMKVGYSRVPSSLRRQLADYWITYSVLGIPDFHAGNWMMHDGKVVGIDLAHVPETTSTLQLKFHQHPFGGYPLYPAIRSLLIKNISPELKIFLNTISLKKLNAIARESHYELPMKEAQSIIGRIKLLEK